MRQVRHPTFPTAGHYTNGGVGFNWGKWSKYPGKEKPPMSADADGARQAETSWELEAGSCQQLASDF
jgi:hypothetical protein